MKHVSLEAQDESVKQFILSLSSDAGGSVLELGGRAVACIVPLCGNGSHDEDDNWTEAKNARRCALIDREIAGTLTPPEAEELFRLQGEMLRHRRRVAPLPLEDVRALHQQLLAQSRDVASSGG